MADTPEDDELLLEQQDEGEEPEQQEEQEQGSEKAGDEADEELEVYIGDEAAPASGERETGLAKHLREEIRRRDKEIAELRKTPPKPEIEVGPKPTLWDSAIDGDEDKYDEALLAWNDRKAEAAKAETEQQRAQREANEDFARDRQAFETTRQSLKVVGREDAIAAVEATLDFTQQAVLTKAGKDAALLEQGIGRNPVLLAELASIKDPIKLALRLGELKGKIQMAPRRKAPEPEQIERGNASVRQGKDATLERLEKQAEKTGDRTELIRYRRQQADRAKK
jgi:hypothetical protein